MLFLRNPGGTAWSGLFHHPVETILGICIFRIVWVFTVFRNYGTLESLYIVFPITWVVTSAAVGISCTVVWKRISHSKQRFQN